MDDGTTRLYRELQALREENARLKMAAVEGHHPDRSSGQGLPNSEEYLRVLFEYAPDAYYLYDLQGRFVGGNRAAEELTGYKREELIGKSFLDLQLLSSESLEKSAEVLARSAAGEATGPNELILCRRDGRRLVIETRTHPVEVDGRRVVLGIARDITERRDSEQARRDAERQFAAFFDLAPVPMAISCLADERLLNVNNAFERDTGYAREEVVGRTSRELGIFVQQQTRDETVRRLMEDKRLSGIEAEYRTKGGERRSAVFAAQMLELGGTPVLLTASADISERKRAEEALSRAYEELEQRVQRRTTALASANEALRESEALYRSLMEISPDAVIVMDVRLCILLVNHQAVRMGGWESAQELIGRQAADLLLLDDSARGSQTLASLVKTGRTTHLDVRIVKKDGSSFPAEVNASTLPDAQGMPEALVAVVRDVTHRKQGDEELRARARQQAAVAELGQLALVSTDLQALMDEACRSVADTLDVEYSKIQELLSDGRSLLLRAGVGWKEGLVGHVTMGTDTDSQAGYTLLAEEPVAVEDLRRETRFTGSPLVHEHGVVSGLTVTIGARERPFGVLGAHSATQRRFTGDDALFLRAVANILGAAVVRERLLRDLQEANNAKDQFLAIVSHELGNPLAAILAGAQFLRDSLPQEETVQRTLGLIERNAKLQARLVSDLLDLARMMRGKMRVQREPVPLGATVRAAVEGQRDEVAKADLSLKVEIAGGLWVLADPGRLEQVVLNLLTNAAKFTPAGGEVRVSVFAVEGPKASAPVGGFAARGRNAAPAGTAPRASMVAPRPATARIVVEDTGIGIDRALLEHLFEMFRQGEAGGGRKPGLGIGLALVRSITAMHGGRVWAESEGPGRGSRFVVELPLIPPPREAPPAAHEA